MHIPIGIERDVNPKPWDFNPMEAFSHPETLHKSHSSALGLADGGNLHPAFPGETQDDCAEGDEKPQQCNQHYPGFI